MKCKHYISVRVDSKEYKSFLVPPEVYTYVLQLEAYIRNPETSKLPEVYPSRFSCIGNFKAQNESTDNIP